MNGAEQVARFSATQRLEKRLEDLELVVVKMAEETVRDREALDTQHQELIDAVNAALTAALAAERAYVDTFLAGQTLWQRLRWLVRGA